MTNPLTDVVLAIHGGAGTIRRADLISEREAAYREALREALHAGRDVLMAAGSALDAVCAAVCLLEDNPLFNAGRGAVLTYDGDVELDASIMDGQNSMAGAITGVRTVKNPVLLARAVMERSPYVLLVGEGAEEFARRHEFETASSSYFETPERRSQLQRLLGKAAGSVAPEMALSEDRKFGTVGAVARDHAGNLAAATSTGGMTGKRFGRVGDSPIVGAGVWASNATCAVSATGHGEYFIRHAVAHDIHARMAYGGASVAEAAGAVIQGALRAAGGEGGVIALDALGNAALPFNTPGMYRGILRANGEIKVAIFDAES
jgi:beta-aspartyl-peptidase (threonine type)